MRLRTFAASRRVPGSFARSAAGELAGRLADGGASGEAPGPVVLYDGACNLCAGAIRFIARRDRRRRFRFAPLQSDLGQRLPGADREAPAPEGWSLVLVENGRAHRRSGAVLRIARRLDGAWPLAAALLAVPAPLRDAAYRLVARNRYTWFGTRTDCDLPPADGG